MSTRKVLILGATGKQGAAVIDALLSLPKRTTSLELLALTRNPASAKIQSLTEAAKPKGVTITPVEGDIKASPSPVFRAHPSIDTSFIVTTPGNEDVAGKAWVDASIDAGASQIVLTSVDRGGEDKSWTNPTNIPHFYQKHEIELHLRDRADELEKNGRKLKWTILRPTAFMDNTNPGTFGKVFAAMWSTLPADRPLQFVSVRDIGLFAAGAIAEPEKWDRRAVSLAGDDITYAKAREVFKNVVGSEMPQTYTIFGQGMMWAISDVGRMFDFFKREGYGADIQMLRREQPKLQDFETWLKESSGWSKEKSEI
ncbi:nucleoside-diphosphate-sugar epimerase family protein [Colletotrichum truncatum]|uniref:Nucleoside-diphosphate-sugar epimerase family protein n=1 Tax=Colletotrichum truncatum TaxID=5467 RepID=A0ACC3YRA1_COLTU|nr:nucleoside-diphosphate-sugar epimerase family protein [Colletotrichum truncatum]KAF6799152.1 nucleoside-diphosphate-sugar epimerase family protein [Colletotrichum truncatum]